MGVLSYMAGGAVEGAGRGIATYGLDLMRGADDAERERIRQEDRLELVRERAALSGAGRGASGKASPAQELSELADLVMSGKAPGVLRAGGMTPDRAADGSEMLAGRTPMASAAMPADRFTNPDRQDAAAAQPQAAQAPKYADGQAQQLAADSFIALRRAMGIVRPEAADNIAKAEGTETGTGLLKQFAGGDNQAGRALLAERGNGSFNDSGDTLTGAVPRGSVAESRVRENNAQAGKAGAEAAAKGAETRGDVPLKDQIATIDAQRKKLATDLKDARAAKSDKGYLMLEDVEKKAINDRIKTLQNRSDDIEGQYQSLVQRMAGGKVSGKADDKPAGKGITKAAYDALPVGSTYVGPDGKTYRKR